VIETTTVIEDILSVNATISATDSVIADDNIIAKEFDMEMSYTALNEVNTKLISFLKLQKEIENGFLCKKCICITGILGLSASTLSLHQETYGIATVLKFSCGNHHTVEIIPECVNKDKANCYYDRIAGNMCITCFLSIWKNADKTWYCTRRPCKTVAMKI